MALQFSLELKVELGPSKQELGRLAGTVTGTTGAVAAGVVGVGRAVVISLSRGLKEDARAAKLDAWKASFAKNANELDFGVVRESVLKKLVPYENDPPPLAPLVDNL